MYSGKNEFYLQRPQILRAVSELGDYGREHSTGGRLNFSAQVPMSESRNGRDRAGSYPSQNEVYNQVPPCYLAARNPVKTFYEDRLMQHSRLADGQIRDELVGIEPSSISQFPEFEGILYGMKVLIIKWIAVFKSLSLEPQFHRNTNLSLQLFSLSIRWRNNHQFSDKPISRTIRMD